MSRSLILILAIAAALAGCSRDPDPAPTSAAAEPTPTNRIDINAAVRQNLGITFARVESRSVARTLRVPGRFELLPTARRESRAPAGGAVELLVRQYQHVEPGDPLYRLDTPRWRELQGQLTDAAASIALAQAALDSIGPFTLAHEAHHTEIERAVDLFTERVATLEQLHAAGGSRAGDLADARAALADARAEHAETLEKEAELTARSRDAAAQLEAALARNAFLLESAASLTGRSVADLTASHDGRPRWQTITQIEVTAAAPGVVDTLHAVSGAIVEIGAPVVTLIQPELIQFRAHALQSDLGRLTNDLPAMVVAPQGGSFPIDARLPGALTIAPTADAERRTIELIMTPDPASHPPSWARAGVSAFLEVVVEGSGTNDLAIPLASVVRDGTQRVIFRRSPANPDEATRMEADLGVDDGRWVVIRSGVAEGNEVVLDGAYQLMVATSGGAAKGGHFHPDGTFHEGDE